MPNFEVWISTNQHLSDMTRLRYQIRGKIWLLTVVGNMIFINKQVSSIRRDLVIGGLALFAPSEVKIADALAIQQRARGALKSLLAHVENVPAIGDLQAGFHVLLD